MKYFFDTEFIERPYTIDLISIGIISEEGKTLYLINRDCDLSMASDWVRENVLSQMPEYDAENDSFFDTDNVMSRTEIAEAVLEFVDDNPEFWAYYADYDWVVFCWLFGAMIDLPNHFPMYCRDLKQELDRLHINEDKLNVIIPQNNVHNALFDGIWAKKVYEYLNLGYQ